MTAPPVALEHVDHFYGSGSLRRQVLHDLALEIGAGEIVILTGPSGSGKTTALTLIGALRSAQQGSVRVLGHELCGARERELVRVRRRIGYVFQHHNLLDSLTATQNVEMSAALDGDSGGASTRHRAVEMLEAVGLGEHLRAHPNQLSGGQRQRVAIARALAGHPELLLADEPTASLDRQSGREVVRLIERLAREQGVAVVLVTHDNRILDVADRIVHLEDGRLKSFGDAVMASTRHLMELLAQSHRKGELTRRVLDLSASEFQSLLEGITQEAQEFLRVNDQASREAFGGMLESVLEAFTHKIGELIHADRASIFLLDAARNELWSKGARDATGRIVEIRIPRDAGIAGAVMASGAGINVPDAHEDPRFDASADERTGYRTRGLLCVPLRTRGGEVFGTAQLLNRRDGEAFSPADQERLQGFMEAMSVILESWWRMREATTAGHAGV